MKSRFLCNTRIKIEVMKEYTGLVKLSVLVVVLPLFVWSFALKRSVGLWKRYTAEKVKSEQLSEQKLPLPNEMKQEEIGGSLLVDGKLLDGLTEIIRRENVGVVSYLPVVLHKEGKYCLYAGELVLAGRYGGLLRFMDVLETEMPSVKIVSAGFRLFKERYNDKPELHLALIVVELAGEK